MPNDPEIMANPSTLKTHANRPKSGKPRRPSKQLYTPPPAKTASPEPPSSDHVSSSNSLASNCIPSSVNSISSNTSASTSPSPKYSKSMSDSNQVLNSLVKVKNQLEDDSSWDNLYDDSGDLIDSDIAASLESSLKLENEKASAPTLERPSSESSDYRSSSSSFNQYGHCDKSDHSLYPHVLEVYQFNADLKTKDLFYRISTCGTNDFDILWVDETHALAIFGSVTTANNALRNLVMSDLSLRPMSEATEASKLKAKSDLERLTQSKKRPQTSLDTARRLVGRHLGVTVHVSRESMLAEKKLLQEARDRRRREKKQAADAWEGSSN